MFEYLRAVVAVSARMESADADLRRSIPHLPSNTLQAWVFARRESSGRKTRRDSRRHSIQKPVDKEKHVYWFNHQPLAGFCGQVNPGLDLVHPLHASVESTLQVQNCGRRSCSYGEWRRVLLDPNDHPALKQPEGSIGRAVKRGSEVADALRLGELFIGPLSAGGPWLSNGIDGVFRFLQRTWRLIIDEDTGQINSQIVDSPPESTPDLDRLLHKTIRNVTEALESLDKMNTAVSQLMIFSNAATQAETLPRKIIEDYLRLLAPMAPHIADELWQRLGHAETMTYEPWPQYDPELVVEELISIPVQVNGRVQAVIEVQADAPREEIEQLALNHNSVLRHLREREVKRVIYVPGRLVNLVA